MALKLTKDRMDLLCWLVNRCEGRTDFDISLEQYSPEAASIRWGVDGLRIVDQDRAEHGECTDLAYNVNMLRQDGFIRHHFLFSQLDAYGQHNYSGLVVRVN